MFIVTFVTILLLSLGWLFIWVRNHRNVLHKFPVPPYNFFFGHLLEIVSTTDILKVSLKYVKQYGSNLKLYVSVVRTALLTTDYKLIEFLLTSNKILTKSENYKFLKPWLGSGLLITDGSTWKRHRKFLTPAFHFEILKQFLQTFDSVGDILLDELSIAASRNGGKSVDLYPIITLCTLDIICETAMDTKIGAQKDKESKYVRAVKEMCRIIIGRGLNPFKVFESTFVFTRDYYKHKSMLEILHSYTKGVIEKKLTRKGRPSADDEGTTKMAFLDLLLKYSDGEGVLSLEEIRNEVDTFMFEGHDTTASGISFTLFCLANHPEVLSKVLQEQVELYGHETKPDVTYADLQNMRYLECVIKESLRLYPPVPLLGRMLTEDVIFDNQTFPKNLSIAIFVYGIHRNPHYFPDPERFDPSRFEKSDGTLPYAYIPFSAGPRNCIGHKFAMLEMKSVISKVVRNFELFPAYPRHDLILAAEIVLKSTNGIKVGLRKRED